MPTRAPPITTWLPESEVILPPGVMMSVCGVSKRGRPGAAIGAGIGVAHLRDADHAGLADVTAEIEGFGVGVGVGEVRIGLPGEEPAQGAVGIAQPRDQIIRDVCRPGCGAAGEVVGAGKVEFDEGARLAIGGRGAGLDVEARFTRALREDAVAARMVELHRHDKALRAITARNRLAMNIERLRQCLAVVADRRGLDAVGRPVLDPVVEGFVDKPADPDRGVGAWDQKRPRKAAAGQGWPGTALVPYAPPRSCRARRDATAVRPGPGPGPAGRCAAGGAADWREGRTARRPWPREAPSAARPPRSSRQSPPRCRNSAFLSSFPRPCWLLNQRLILPKSNSETIHPAIEIGFEYEVSISSVRV